MPTTFPKAPRVTKGDVVTSAQFRGLAEAFNARLRLIGDLPWRISWYWYTLFRQVRNPDSSGFAFPPQGEWWEIYAHIDPDYTTTNWPATAPGEAEGANLANPAMQFVYGAEGGADDEPTRAQIPLAQPNTLLGYWQLGKDQRGAYDPATGAQNAPAFDAALSVFDFWFGGLIPYHKGYGGWLPQPELLEEHCGETEESGLNIPSFAIKFTALKDGVATDLYHGAVTTNGDGKSVVTYAGTCPCGTELHGAGHVLGVVRHPLYYIVYVSQGDGECTPDIDYLPTRDWIEGPYEAAPHLEHTEGEQLQRGAWQFLTDFRGSDEQREVDGFAIESIGFDSQDFFLRQYPLAPARGSLVGSVINEIYPTATLIRTGSIPAGTWATWAPGQTEYSVGLGFVVAGLYAWGSGLAGPAVLDILDGDTRVGAVTLTPDGSGAAEALLWLREGVAATRLRLRPVADVPVLGAGAGSIQVEFAELLAWKPYWWDAVTVVRNAGSLGGDTLTAGVDGRGMDNERAAEITRGLAKYGCLVNPDATAVRPQAEWVNDNPLYDAMRRLARNQVRITPRRQLVGYEVSGGKSILYFKRFAYGLHNQRVDMFDGIAPPLSPVVSGDLVPGETYLVRGTSGAVTYQGATVGIGAAFTATAVVEFEVSGDAKVYVRDGIRHAARQRGTTNEWVMFLETKCYHPSESSIWKPAAYSDYFTWNQRCLFYPFTMPGVVRRQVAVQYGVALDGDNFSLARLPMRVQTSVLAPEAPPGYRFAAGTNTGVGGASEEFCKACRLYESPYEIESCTVDDWAADQVIKIVLTSRLRSHPDAPSTVGRNAGAWSGGEVADLEAEDWRTDDNAVREYMRHVADGAYHCTLKTGDAGWASNVPFLTDGPFGSCYPTFHCVRLVPLPYEDGNTSMEPTDTRVLVDAYQQMEAYLRIACEAFVDGRTSADLNCRLGEGNLYDYTFENLCHDAFGGRWIGAFSTEARPDDGPGFGPLPNTLIYAETHNRLAAAIDLLVKLRIDLPVVVSTRENTGSATKAVTALPAGASCSDTGAVAAWVDNAQPPAVGAVTEGSWVEAVGLSFGATASQTASLTCGFEIRTDRLDVEWKVEVAPTYLEALPQYLRDLFDGGKVGLAAKTVTTVHREAREAAPDLASSDECCRADHLPCPGHWGESGTYYRWIPTEEIQETCEIRTGGSITAGSPPSGGLNLGRDTDMSPGVFCSNSLFHRVEVTLYSTTPFVEFGLTP